MSPAASTRATLAQPVTLRARTAVMAMRRNMGFLIIPAWPIFDADPSITGLGRRFDIVDGYVSDSLQRIKAAGTGGLGSGLRRASQLLGAPPMTVIPLRSNPGSRTDTCDPESVHRDLAAWNHERLNPGLNADGPASVWIADLHREQVMRFLEADLVEGLRSQVRDRAAEAPADPEGFVAWFDALKENGPGQGDPLFPWLARDASLEEMRWFLTQEAAGEAGFDDLVALTQIKLGPARAKLELARNYWDEMGRGNEGGMHGPMLDKTVEALDLRPTIEGTVTASLMLANVMTAMATHRRYALHSLGALGVVELTAPGRVAQVAQGLKRLGAPPVARKYFALHAVLDVEHSRQWNEEALKPVIAERPETAAWIAEGALMRLACGQACFEAYRAHLWSGAQAMAAE
jgi:hypothetical protein